VRYSGGHADALNALGWYHAQLRRYEEAVGCCRRALALHENTGHLLGQAGTLDSLGYAYDRLGRHEAALACYQRRRPLLNISKPTLVRLLTDGEIPARPAPPSPSP
jgi:tetratricopeptide (TPR) repeat protein